MSKRLAFVLVITLIVVWIGGYIMPHGYPPWSGVKKQTVFSLPIDMGELAARLGSPVTFDRRGDVIYADTFEHGLNKWYLGDVWENAEVYLSSAKALHGAYSCKMETSDAEGFQVWISRYFQPTVVGQVGVEVSYQLVDEQVDIELSIAHFTGTDEYAYHIKHDTSADTLYYQNATPEWVPVLTDAYATRSATGWNTIKLVVDLESEEFVRATFNDQGAPLSGYTSARTTIGTEAAIYIATQAWGDTDAVYPVYLDRIIVTQNEP